MYNSSRKVKRQFAWLRHDEEEHEELLRVDAHAGAVRVVGRAVGREAGGPVGRHHGGHGGRAGGQPRGLQRGHVLYVGGQVTFLLPRQSKFLLCSMFIRVAVFMYRFVSKY